MNDVAYRINTLAPVKAQGGICVTGSSAAMSGAFKFNRDNEKTYANENVATGLVNRFDETTYYTA